MSKFYSPSELAAYEPPVNVNLVGDHHLQKGATVVLGGAPGVGKSLAVKTLTLAGATGEEWFGLTVHHQFKSLVIQGENSLNRLKKDFETLNVEFLDQWIRVSEPSMDFSSPDFMASVTKEIKEFMPDCIVLDPWNHIPTDDDINSYNKALKQIELLTMLSEKEPLILIVAHTRKPNPDSKAVGRALLHELSGSHKLASYPRAVFIIEALPESVGTNLVKFTCCKNNDGECGDPTIWKRQNGSFIEEANSQLAQSGSQRASTGVTLEQVRESLKTPLPKKDAVKKLMSISGKKEATCYKQLKLDGAFSEYLAIDNGLLQFRDINDPDQENSNSTKTLGGEAE